MDKEQERRRKIKENNAKYWLGKKRSKKDREKMSRAKQGKYNGSNNPSWKGGKPNCPDCGKQLSTYTPKRCMPCSIKHRSGKNHYEWKGKNVGYRGLHRWVEKELGKPTSCEKCGISEIGHNMHWANKSGEYKREKSDWIRLCPKCHKQYDLGRLIV